MGRNKPRHETADAGPGDAVAASPLAAQIARFERARSDLDAIVREAHEVIGTLKLVIKEYKEIQPEVKKISAESLEEVIQADLRPKIQEVADEFADFRDHFLDHMCEIMQEVVQLAAGYGQDAYSGADVFLAISRKFKESTMREAWIPPEHRDRLNAIHGQPKKWQR